MVASGGAMIFRDLGVRARAEGARAIRVVVDGVRDRLAGRPENELYIVRAAEEHPGEAVWWSRTDPDAEPPAITGDDTEVAKSLDRIAETIDRLAAQLDAAHAERAE